MDAKKSLLIQNVCDMYECMFMCARFVLHAVVVVLVVG